MEIRLLVVGGRVSKNIIPVALPTVIGRSREAKLTIAHPMVSRRHCRLTDKDGLLMLEDLGSLNGTVVNNQRVKVAPLPPDSEFTIGPLTFRAQYQFDGDLASLPATVFDDKSGDDGHAATDGSTSLTSEPPETSPFGALPPLPSGVGLDDDFAILGGAGNTLPPAPDLSDKDAATLDPNKPTAPIKLDD